MALKVYTCAELMAMEFPAPPPIPFDQPDPPETPHDAPVKMWWGRTVSLKKACQILAAWGDRPGRILQRWGVWVVTTNGVECLSPPYSIEWERVDEDWEEHLCRKTWPVPSDVVAVFKEARQHPKALAWRRRR